MLFSKKPKTICDIPWPGYDRLEQAVKVPNTLIFKNK